MSFSPITNLVQTFRFCFGFFWLNVFTKEKLQIVKTKKKLIIKQEMGLFVFLNLLCVAGLTDKVTGGDADM